MSSRNYFADIEKFTNFVVGKGTFAYEQLPTLKTLRPEVCEKIFREHFAEKDQETWRWYLENGKITANFIREFADKIDFRWHLSHNENITKDIIWEFEDKWNWNDLIRRLDWTSDNLMRIEQKVVSLNWNDVVRYQNFDSYFLDYLITSGRVNTEEGWTRISDQKKLAPWFIEKYEDHLNWFYILRNNKLKESFLEKYCHKWDYNDWCACSKYQKLSESFIEKHKNSIDWELISANQDLSEDFMRKYSRKLSWGWIFDRKKLSIELIEENVNRIKRHQSWFPVSAKQDLTEDFMRKYDKYLYWDLISIQQKLSPQFVRDYFDRLDWCNVKNNKKNSFSPEFIKEMDELEIKTKPAWQRNYSL